MPQDVQNVLKELDAFLDKEEANSNLTELDRFLDTQDTLSILSVPLDNPEFGGFEDKDVINGSGSIKSNVSFDPIEFPGFEERSDDIEPLKHKLDAVLNQVNISEDRFSDSEMDKIINTITSSSDENERVALYDQILRTLKKDDHRLQLAGKIMLCNQISSSPINVKFVTDLKNPVTEVPTNEFDGFGFEDVDV